MNKDQLQVIKWWHSGRNYDAGLRLFSTLSKNKVLIHTLSKRSAKFGQAKLNYELTKAVGLNFRKMPALPKESQTQTGQAENIQQSKKQTVTLKPSLNSEDVKKEFKKQYPKIIRRLKYEYSNLYNERSILHKKMGYVPENNSKENMDARAKLLEEMRDLSLTMERIHYFIEIYEKDGTVPQEDEVWPTQKDISLPEDPVQLKKLKKNLQSSISKDNNRLNYQSTRRQEKLLPMPRGPKRHKIELRIKKREAEIQLIEQKLMELENAD